MRTPAQIEASRRNGAKSRGPKTAAGKRHSARNATSHGLLSKTVVLEGESATGFSNLLASLIAEHQPCTVTELGLVEVMAVNRWRQLRLWRLEKAGITHALDKQDPSSPDSLPHNPARRATLAVGAMNIGRSLETLLRYEAGFARQHLRAIHALDQLRMNRVRRGEPLMPSSALHAEAPAKSS
jgi:hypothetical protein